MRDVSRCLGLIGGLGVGATVHYYQALAKALEKRDVAFRLLLVHADLPTVLLYAKEGRLKELSAYLEGLLRQLRDGGAEIAAVASVTPHLCFGELIPRSPLPLVSLLSVAREAILGRRIALFGTRFTIDTDLFGALQGGNTVRPSPNEVDRIHNVYVRAALRGVCTEEDRRVFTSVAHTLIEREDLEGIVFAGTDLALFFDAANTSFPFIDCAQLHVDSIVKALTGEPEVYSAPDDATEASAGSDPAQPNR